MNRRGAKAQRKIDADRRGERRSAIGERTPLGCVQLAALRSSV